MIHLKFLYRPSDVSYWMDSIIKYYNAHSHSETSGYGIISNKDRPDERFCIIHDIPFDDVKDDEEFMQQYNKCVEDNGQHATDKVVIKDSNIVKLKIESVIRFVFDNLVEDGEMCVEFTRYFGCKVQASIPDIIYSILQENFSISTNSQSVANGEYMSIIVKKRSEYSDNNAD